uniref:Uncharacterized protein n=1 Tax=Panagrolaimus sp. JU765 TaxID=591449 RepID=A0AC34Q844_9BILA
MALWFYNPYHYFPQNHEPYQPLKSSSDDPDQIPLCNRSTDLENNPSKLDEKSPQKSDENSSKNSKEKDLEQAQNDEDQSFDLTDLANDS